MPSNKYFQNYDFEPEQNLIEDLYSESVEIHGLDVWYIPRTILEKNEAFREATITRYDEAVQTVVYIDSAEAYGGQGSFMSRFGLEFREEISLSFPVKNFRDEVVPFIQFPKPRHGDLIWFPLGKNLFQIIDRKDYDPFYQAGSLYRHQITAQLFEYSNETFATGITEIDDLYNSMDFREVYEDPIPEIDFSVLNDVDPQAMNKTLQSEGEELINSMLTHNPFGQP